MFRLFTHQHDKTTTGIKGEELTSLLVLCLVLAVMGFMPNDVFDLRKLESFFPLLAISFFLCSLVYRYASKSTGFFGASVILMILYRFMPDSYALMILLTFYMVLYFGIVFIYPKIAEREGVIFHCFRIFALLNAAWIVMQALNFYLIFYPLAGTIRSGVFANNNEAGIFGAMMVGFFFRGKWWWGVPIIACGIYLSNCTNAVIATAFVSIIYIIYLLIHHRKVRLRFLIIGVIIAIPTIVALAIAPMAYNKNVHEGGYEVRIDTLKSVIQVIKEKPLLGWGIGQSPYIVSLFINGEKQRREYVIGAYSAMYHQEDFRQLYQKHHNYKNAVPGVWQQVHNDFAQWVVDAGLIGLAALLLVMIAHAVAFLKTKSGEIMPALCIIAALVSANAFFTFQIGRFTFIAVLCLGLIQGRYLTESKKHILTGR